MIKGRKACDSSYEVENDKNCRRRKDHYREDPEGTEFKAFDSRLDFFDRIFKLPYIDKKETSHKSTYSKGQIAKEKIYRAHKINLGKKGHPPRGES